MSRTLTDRRPAARVPDIRATARRCATRPTGAGRRATTRPAASARRTRRPWALRLTRRGRLLLVLVVAALLMAAFSLGRVSTQAATDAPAAPRHVTVQQGETLWQFAARIAPHRDPRVVVQRLEQLNNLDGAGLRAGQELLVP